MSPAEPSFPPPRVAGKFLFAGDQKLWIQGVTYGTFGPDAGGIDYPGAGTLAADFVAMAANGINAVRVYTVPPLRVLDEAQRHGLRVMVGLPWEQHIAFLDDPKRAESIVEHVRGETRRCAGHPALLCYAVGNEIPASIVRWHGRERVERFIRRLYDTVKGVDGNALVTYVNFPTTEYLQLPFLDFVCFNVYLESYEKLDAYLGRLQNLAGERPLVLAEIGLDSRRHGELAQAECIAWQTRCAFSSGCAGTFAFAWTDEWHRGGFNIEDWDFGLTTRDRRPKPALAALRAAYSEVPFATGIAWPKVSVVVCSYNGERTISDTLEGLKRLAYPNFDVLVVDDGSRDATPRIAAQYPVRVISTENRGLSSARNTGWQNADGEIIAYIDDDAYPDPHWLHYIASTFMTGDWVAVGGPNIAPTGDGPIADCVANAPGGPVHVLISDREAEHVPGCNMAIRRDALAAIGGFDPLYRTAGDDVDVCWRLRERGGRIGFHAGAMDWHHRRNSLSMYWRQQKGYGKAEALLEQKWPQHYNAAGHLAWGGRLYGRGFPVPIPVGHPRIYAGVWGSAGYQSLYASTPWTLLSLPLMPEWYLVIALLAFLSLLGLAWAPLLMLLPLLALALAAPVVQAATGASRAVFPVPATSRGQRVLRWCLTFYLHLMQPLARFVGRLQYGLTPWRRPGRRVPNRRWLPRAAFWSEVWYAPEEWARRLESTLRSSGAVVHPGGVFDPWDLQVRGGLLGAARGLLAIEEHGAGKQLVRIRARLLIASPVWILVVLTALLALLAAWDGAWLASAALLLADLALVAWAWRDVATAAGAWHEAVRRVGASEDA